MRYLIEEVVVFDAAEGMLFHKECESSGITLPAPAIRLLAVFISMQGKDVPRDYLLDNVWGNYGYTSSGHNLNKYVSTLRKAFKDLGLEKEFIETIPRFGFRVIGEVTVLEQNREHAQEIQSTQLGEKKKSKAKNILISAVVVIISLAASLIFYLFENKSQNYLFKADSVSEKCNFYKLNSISIPENLKRKIIEDLQGCTKFSYNIYYDGYHLKDESTFYAQHYTICSIGNNKRKCYSVTNYNRV